MLVVDDHPVNRLVTVRLLQQLGYPADVASDGDEAVRMAHRYPYDCIVMDCQMPGIDGYEATRLIRATERDRRTPIVALTAHADPADRRRALDAGMDDYITKPVGTRRLAEALGRWTPLPESGTELARRVAAWAASAARAQREEADDWDPARLRQLEALDPDIAEAAVRMFEEATPTALDVLRLAVARADAGEIARTAHGIIGSAVQVGAMQVAARARRIEDDARAGRLDALEAAVDALEQAHAAAAKALETAHVADRSEEPPRP